MFKKTVFIDTSSKRVDAINLFGRYV